MNYIVFDLEWNQNPDGRKHPDSRLPFEIIEIGAVKLNEKREIIDTFQCLIKPKVYHWIHDSIHEVIHVDFHELENGLPFPKAIRRFLEWCGQEYRFFTWGNQDVMELQRNMKYYNLLKLIPGPVHYYDVQKLFSVKFEDGIARRSLEYAIDYLKLPKNRDFHRALADASYTARILLEIDEACMIRHPSLDVYQNPKSKEKEIYISYTDHDKFVSREFVSKERLMKDRTMVSTVCPICRCPAKRKIRWFSTNNSKVYYSLALCHEHGPVAGKIRIRKTDEGKYFGVKTLKAEDTEAADEIREMTEGLLKAVMKETLGVELETPIRQITWNEAMDRFGSDKPDIRFGMELKNMADVFRGAGFKVFDSALENGGQVKAVCVPGGADKYSRKKIEEKQDYIKRFGARGLAWMKVTDEGLAGPVAKFFKEREAEVKEAACATPHAHAASSNSLAFIISVHLLITQPLNYLTT